MLPVDRDINALPFIEQLHMMNKFFGNSYARTTMNSIELCGTCELYNYLYIYIIFLRI